MLECVVRTISVSIPQIGGPISAVSDVASLLEWVRRTRLAAFCRAREDVLRSRTLHESSHIRPSPNVATRMNVDRVIERFGLSIVKPPANGRAH